MIRLPKSLTVLYHNEAVGTLSMTPDNHSCVFQYNQRWLATGFSISPLELPLTDELLVPKTNCFYGNFGIFEDSMPDGYGSYLLNKLLQKYGLSLLEMTPVERLSLVGENGMGALVYVPQVVVDEKQESATLDQIQKDALAVLTEKDFSSAGNLYIMSGNSGGCRPKCLWKDENGSWLVKFRHYYDPLDMGMREYDILQKAKMCGIRIPDCKLFNGKYLGTRRFDLTLDGKRLHVATAAALLGESISFPMMDYRKLIRFTAHLTKDMSQAQEMYRRMIFNYEIGNNDDHAKNFSFICDGSKWSIAPAYDITECRNANNGIHASIVNGKERPDIDDFLAVASDAGLTKRQASGIISQIREVLDGNNIERSR